MTSHIITVTNRKGGTGKTTVATTLGHGLALRAESRVLLVDLDAQGHCAQVLNLDPAPGAFDLLEGRRAPAEFIRPARPPRLDLVPGNRMTHTVEAMHHHNHIGLDVAAARLRQAGADYDFVILDTPPDGYPQELALYAADTLLIPAALDYLAVDGVAAVMETLAALRTQHGRTPQRVCIVPFFGDHTNESKAQLAELHTHYGACVGPVVPRRVTMREATSFGLTIWEFDPSNDVCAAFEQLMARMLPPYNQPQTEENVHHV